jgi:hypothetical protein
MKKYLVITIMLLFSISIFGQQYKSFKDIPGEILDKLDKMGVDKSTLLNSYESEFFNVFFKDEKKDFDFTGKKVGFIASSTGKMKNKVNYFKKQKSQYNKYKRANLNYYDLVNAPYLYIFDEKEKEESGGYDAAILYCRNPKFHIMHPKENVIKKLKDKKRK